MQKGNKKKEVKYYLNQKDEFVIENYNFSKPLANFFPGIAGKYGIPMWVFYVNRGQCVCSFGTKDKDHAILEFFPANKAWQLVSSLGFRTFIKTNFGKKHVFYEPFHNGFVNLGFDLVNRMRISSHGLTIEEENLTLGLAIKAEFFNIPNDSYAGLARIVTVKNLGRKPKKIQLLDGLPQIVPFGTSNLFLKKLGRTIEAWMNVENLQKGVPFYKLAVDPTDRPEVLHIKEGNFYLGFRFDSARAKIIKPIIDPQYIFGPITDYSCPSRFLEVSHFKLPKKEIVKSRTPSAFILCDMNLAPLKESSLYEVTGYMRNLEALNAAIPRITASGYLAKKEEEAKKLISGLQSDIDTSSSSKAFDLYSKQTYLDNIMRGGYPLTFESGDKKSVFYLYSRKHGDLERDYNKFQLQPTYFSQGNGNYRDMNQNRRCDAWFNPDIKDENLIDFFNLIQADGFNPLVVKGVSFVLEEAADLRKVLGGFMQDRQIEIIEPILRKPFTPGELVLFMEDKGIKLKSSYDKFLGALFSCSVKIHDAEHGEGFWIDHWCYNLDLLENYLWLYPEESKSIFFDKKVFTFYDNTEAVKPRQDKYILKDGCVRQLHSVAVDTAKKEMIKKRPHQPHLVRAGSGAGEIYRTTLVNKLLCLLVNKLASFDPQGTGIEMEADKPNWFDALNGLPALLGSSSCEAFELKRMVLQLKDTLVRFAAGKIQITEEILYFLIELNRLIEEYLKQDSVERDYLYWDKSNSLKEGYRHKVRFGFSGNESGVDSAELLGILDNALAKINISIDKAKDKKSGVYCSYFINEVAKYEPLKPPHFKPVRFTQKELPLFLEAQMHALRLAASHEEAQSLFQAVKSSELFDKKLKMYKVTASLKDMPEEIGRCRVFTPGWLENESIWLHMEYKYLLEALKQGLYDQFYADFKNVLVPFQDPKRYGRSILENSSFLVSSAFPDKSLQGNGFVARLSGSTAEFLNIWLLMNAGPSPFSLNQKGELSLKFSPILAGWLFNRKGIYSFNFLSRVRVTYHNPKRKDTFGKKGVKPVRIVLKNNSGSLVEIASGTIPSPYAVQIRSRQITNLDIYLS